MSHPVQRHSTLVVTLAALLATLAAASRAHAHGSLEFPPSRTYACRFLEPDNPMCRQAWDANPQALYDWMEVNIGNAAGRHQELIPDGTLCGAGRSKYAAFDATGTSWPTTELEPDTDGLYTLTWTSWAPRSPTTTAAATSRRRPSSSRARCHRLHRPRAAIRRRRFPLRAATSSTARAGKSCSAV
jgi:predicted carbohydrate-binding protein with CBM5 and CBM33 domain